MTDSIDVLDRDGRRCVNCDTALTADRDPDASVWDPGERHSGAEMVTVCADCAALLDGATPAWRDRLAGDPAAGGMGFLRTVTKTQGSVVADIAALATETTGGLDDDDGRREYRDGRRRSALGLAVVDRHLAAAGVDRSALDPLGTDPSADEYAVSEPVLADTDLDRATVEAFETVLNTATALQRQLRTVLGLVETAVSVEGRCHVCLESILGTEACPSCGTAVRDADQWRDDTGELDTAGLYRAITSHLETASETTTQLTDQAASLADRLAV
ncbi:hypothetical protein Halru_0950 [Halovivax ruber XH-70]|uniref:Uncharacterized protein n=1 Tax=Halovivax ruber (strain DSM 18193 / JCM 13892 / XH-70) TaxID=797302 RepID=L0I7L6_HALRX|nr:hypothetical protein [Halovivax ruber]AGB15570.1 hypothetical protein Halru_0950 [Halovivax ruber XH-70]